MINNLTICSLIIGSSIICSSLLERAKPEFHFAKDNWVATVRTNQTTGERCLLADGVFRIWKATDIQQDIERLEYELSHAPLNFCEGETPPIALDYFTMRPVYKYLNEKKL